MIKLIGKIVSGCKKATQTVKEQSQYFEKAGIEKEVLTNGTINVDISPNKWKVTNPDFKFRNIEWEPNFVEDFNFVKIKLIFEGKKYAGYLYNPKRTKDPKTTIEILTKYIKEVKYGKNIELLIPDNEIKIIN